MFAFRHFTANLAALALGPTGMRFGEAAERAFAARHQHNGNYSHRE